jgi:hypothetical protein
MKATVEAEGQSADPQPLSPANEDFKSAAGGADKVTHQRSGWDPYEVWRTRIQEMQEEAEPIVGVR